MRATSELFRQEVVRARSERLQGAVSIVTPISWQIVGYLLLTAMVATAVFLASASYARIETVSGQIALDRGVATLLPSRSGMIDRIFVREGQQVTRGSAMFAIRSEEDMAGGTTAPSLTREALSEQDTRLSSQNVLMQNAARADAGRLYAQLEGAVNEITSIDAQIADQQRLLDSAISEYNEVEKVAQKGFISRRDMQARQDNKVTRSQQLAQLRQIRAAKVANANETRRTITQSAALSQAQIAANETQRAQLRERLASTQESSGYIIRAPFSGVLTAMTARIGQRALPDQPLGLVVPRSARTTVEIYVPTSAAGFVKTGQQIRLAIDAFPYQRFGTVETVVQSISKAAVPRQIGSVTKPVYIVTGRLADPTMAAFGRQEPILPGMTLTARIVTERRTLLEWLFEPIFAVRYR